MKSKILTLAFTFVLIAISFSQTLSPCVSDNGGGITSGTERVLLASIGQSVAGIREKGVTLQAGYITVDTLGAGAIFEPNSKPDAESIISSFYPNPFNSSTTISIELSKTQQVLVRIVDVSGKQVFEWGSELSAGNYRICFSADEQLASGTYMYSVNTNDTQKSGKITFVK